MYGVLQSRYMWQHNSSSINIYTAMMLHSNLKFLNTDVQTRIDSPQIPIIKAEKE